MCNTCHCRCPNCTGASVQLVKMIRTEIKTIECPVCRPKEAQKSLLELKSKGWQLAEKIQKPILKENNTKWTKVDKGEYTTGTLRAFHYPTNEIASYWVDMNNAQAGWYLYLDSNLEDKFAGPFKTFRELKKSIGK